ncbi:MAG: precorrin-6y C5,15-methyltransferase (decarboxylating) subunit CbiE [Spirochaetaceae bacterium]|jgi:precorrin-6Y C5,15-methyltransferase (decarboxylating)|nr:precorrin-6y C5,15-methyltransferase (decarboxylating) subunit CbiE [Spirochaetaceae bacterium]
MIQRQRKKVYLIGVGPGGTALITEEARNTIAASSCVLGAPRLLEACAALIQDKPARALTDPNAIIAAIDEGGCPLWAVLFSGDAGAYSGAKRLIPLVREQGWELCVVSGISSWAYFAARLGRAWDDAGLVSLHGRPERRYQDLLGHASHNQSTFFLTDPCCTAGYICRALADNGLGDARVTVGERLSYPDEKITSGAAEELKETQFDPLSVALVENPRARPYASGAVPDREFLREQAPMTKEEVRSIALGKLRLEDRSVAYDIGAGTGSVSCEMAMRARHGTVFAVERRPDRLALTARNSRRLGLYNLITVAGEAPEALAALPPPDRVFIGGSSGNLPAIIAAAAAKNPLVRLVITAASLETLTQSLSALKERAFEGLEITQASISKAVERGGYHLMEGANPVYIISAGGTGRNG